MVDATMEVNVDVGCCGGQRHPIIVGLFAVHNMLRDSHHLLEGTPAHLGDGRGMDEVAVLWDLGCG